MREWLSGGAPPCQGGGRGFDPRLALKKRTIPNWYRSFFRALVWARKFDVYAPLRSALLFHVVADLHPPAPNRFIANKVKKGAYFPATLVLGRYAVLFSTAPPPFRLSALQNACVCPHSGRHALSLLTVPPRNDKWEPLRFPFSDLVYLIYNYCAIFINR